MKFEISTQELNEIINKIQNVVPVKPSVPVFGYFLIEAKNQQLTLTAGDSTVGIRCNMEANISAEGAAVLPAKKLGQLIRELTTAVVEFSSTPQEVTTVVSGSSRFKLKGIKKNDYPTLPPIEEANTLTIEQAVLKDLFYRTSFAVSRDDNRYVLTGLSVEIGNGRIRCIGSDGKRLARMDQSIADLPPIHRQIIIPLKSVDEILKHLGDTGNLTLTLMEDKIALTIDHTFLVTKLLQGDFPDIQRVIPEHSEHTISLHREELLSLLRQVMLFTTDNHHSVRFIFTDGELMLTANTAEFGEGHVSMPVNYHGEKREVAFNPGFFIDILRRCKLETITIGLTDAYNPGIITDGEPDGPLHQAAPLFIIMPMRLSSDTV
jgi:DNA polymerase III subunit beta